MTYELTAIISPGLEGEVIKEFMLKKTLFPKDLDCTPKSIHGGVVFMFEDPAFFHLVKVLRSPTKFMLLWRQFKCRDFPKLFTKIKGLPWNEVLYNSNFLVDTKTTQSRLLHSGRIKETVEKGIKEWLNGNPRKKEDFQEDLKTQRIHISFESDLATIRIDCSGAPNYFRNLRKTAAIAPLRENYASILIKYFVETIRNAEDYTLIDPMCGSGTILSELINQHNYNDQRHFSYEYFSFFRKKNSFYLKKTTLKPYKFKQLIGIEKNEFFKKSHSENFKDKNLIFMYKDFFKLQKKDVPQKKIIALCNLPYGKRIKLADPVNFYKKFIRQSFAELGFEKIGILMPSKYADLLKLPKSLTFWNGGLKVSFCVIDSSFHTNT